MPLRPWEASYDFAFDATTRADPDTWQDRGYLRGHRGLPEHGRVAGAGALDSAVARSWRAHRRAARLYRRLAADASLTGPGCRTAEPEGCAFSRGPEDCGCVCGPGALLRSRCDRG